MKLNEKIYFYRKKAGLSQDALAEAVGVSRQAVHQWKQQLIATAHRLQKDWPDMV